VTDAAAELATLRALCPGAELWTEAGQSVPYLPDLTIAKNGAGSRKVDALLWPYDRDNYPTRLFLSEMIPWSIGGQWTQSVVQGRSWHACSWGPVPANQPWIEILANHLRAFQ
jgi:hypothetical protein